MAVSNWFSGFCKVGLIWWITSFEVAPGKHLLLAFDRIKLGLNNLMFIPLGMLSPEVTMFHFFHVKASFYESWSEVGIFKKSWDCM